MRSLQMQGILFGVAVGKHKIFIGRKIDTGRQFEDSLASAPELRASGKRFVNLRVVIGTDDASFRRRSNR